MRIKERLADIAIKTLVVASAGVLVGIVVLGAISLAEYQNRPIAPPGVQVLAGTAQGSAVQIAPGRYMTAEHVVSGNTKVTVKVGERVLDGDVLWTDPENDLAEIQTLERFTDEEASIAPLSCTSPATGASVHYTGHPFGLDRGIYTGRVAVRYQSMAKWNLPRWPNAQVVDITAAGGSSGSGILYYGKTVGILVGQVPGTNITIVIPAEVICKVTEGKKGQNLG